MDQNQEDIEENGRNRGKDDMGEENGAESTLETDDEKTKEDSKKDKKDQNEEESNKNRKKNCNKDDDQKTSKKWPCIKCKRDASNQSIQCTGCNGWIHIDICAELEDETMKPPFDEKKYRCPKCKESKESKKRPHIQTTTILMRGSRNTMRARRRNEEKEKQEKLKSPIKKKQKIGEEHRKNEMEKKANKVETKKKNDNTDKNMKSLISCRESNLYPEDLESTNDSKHITDGGIQFYVQSLWESLEEDMKNKKVKIVSPSASYYIQKHDSKKEIRKMIDDWELNKYEWVIYPINNKKDVETDGGTHWSLLVYRKIDNTYLHFDPIHSAAVPFEFIFEKSAFGC